MWRPPSEGRDSPIVCRGYFTLFTFGIDDKMLVFGGQSPGFESRCRRFFPVQKRKHARIRNKNTVVLERSELLTRWTWCTHTLRGCVNRRENYSSPAGRVPVTLESLLVPCTQEADSKRGGGGFCGDHPQKVMILPSSVEDV